MRVLVFRPILSVITLFSLTLITTVVKAGPIKASEVQQVVASNPNRQTARSSVQLRVSQNGFNDEQSSSSDDDPPSGKQRVITEEVVEIIEEEPCACPEPKFAVGAFEAAGGGFPWWALGFGAAPLAFVGCCGGGDNNTSPTPSPSVVPSVNASGTPIGSPTPSVSPSIAVSPSVTVSPSGTPPEVPEPATILLFGTGLTGLGYAARRLARKRNKNEKN